MLLILKRMNDLGYALILHPTWKYLCVCVKSFPQKTENDSTDILAELFLWRHTQINCILVSLQLNTGYYPWTVIPCSVSPPLLAVRGQKSFVWWVLGGSMLTGGDCRTYKEAFCWVQVLKQHYSSTAVAEKGLFHMDT